MSTSSPKTAVEIINTWKSDAETRQAFGSLAAYSAYLENPQSSPVKIINAGGKTHFARNKNQQLSPETALAIVEAWKNNADVRAEFGTFNVYRAYREGVATGKIRVFGGANRV
jgi:hypothetical protein